MVHYRARFEPSRKHHALYTELLKFYRDLYGHLKDDFARFAQLRRTLAD